MTSLHRDPKLRASDADRDHVAELLREHAATGRLTMEEFGERLERTYQAQTYGDLDLLVADLPDPDPYAGLPVPVNGPRPRPQAPRHGHRHGGRRRAAWSSWASASIICWGIWLATAVTSGGASGLWPIWVTVPWGGVLLAHELTGRQAEDDSDGATPPELDR